jgi:LuxR family transcriptional regulator, maltose regulon positive regulatory protein
MPASILSTKLYVPKPPPGSILRPRLSDKLLTGLTSPGAWALVSGPAGFGKTTLLGEFIDRYNQPVAWLSLDEADNDPNRFWTYFVAACQSVRPGLGNSALALSQSPQGVPEDAIPTVFINEMAGQEGDLLLVLDDYHLIQNQAIHSAMAFLLEHAPEPLHLVFSTRIDPPWPLARFRSRGWLAEIRAADLRFTEAEAADFLNQTMSLALSPQDIASLEARTEGWIAGLQLAALSMRGRNDITGFVKAFTGSHTFVADYLMEEVLQHQPKEMQGFLLQTSILESLSAGLCDCVTGRQDGGLTLAALKRSNLFLLPLDDEGQWFRYHHLFADLLKARLQQITPPAEVLELQRRATRWYEEAGMPVEAVDHAWLTHDHALVIRIIECASLPMIMQASVQTVEAWLSRIPQDLINENARLCVISAWLFLLQGQLSRALPFVDRLDECLDQKTTAGQDPALAGAQLSLQARVSNMQGDAVAAREAGQKAIAMLPLSESSLRSLTYFEMASACQKLHEYEQAAEIFRRVSKDARASGDAASEIIGISGEGRMLLQLGKLREAYAAASVGLQRVKEIERPIPFSATLYGELGEVHFLWFKIEEANQYFEISQRSSRNSGFSDSEIYHHVMQSRLGLMQGKLDFASAEMKAALRIAADRPPAMVREGLLSQQIRLEVALGRLSSARALITAEGFLREDQPCMPKGNAGARLDSSSGLLFNSAVRVYLAILRSQKDGQPSAPALQTIERMLMEALESHLLPVAIEILLLRSQILQVLGDRSAALKDLRQAVDLGQPEGFVSLFVEAGESIRKALEINFGSGGVGTSQQAYVQKILAVFPTEEDQGEASGMRSWIPSLEGDGPAKEPEAPIEPLTPRELEVLRRIAGGDSNQTIAEALVISVGAVKKHSGNIFRKLGVSSRTQAVARAHKLKLLP